MGILASGAGIAKVIGLLTMPIITRIYTPEDFGVLAVFSTAIFLIVPLSTLFYSITIPLPKTDGMAVNIVFICSVMIVLIASILAMLFAFFGDSIFGFFNMAVIADYWWILLIGIIAASFYELMTYWATRVKAFKSVAKTKVWQALISAILKIGLGLLGYKPLGLFIGDVGQRGGGGISLVKEFYNKFKSNINYVTYNRIKFVLRYYIDFPIYRLPSQFVMKLTGQIPVLYFAYQFGREETGQLGLSLSIIGLPMILLGSSTGKAFYANISRVDSKNSIEIYLLTKSVLRRLILFSVPPFLILYTLSPVLFAYIFGSEWHNAGEFTRILSIYLLSQFMYSPIGSYIFNVYKEQSKVLLLNLIRLILVVTIFVLSSIFVFNPYNTLWVYALSMSVYYLYSTTIAFKVIKSNIK